MVVDIFCVFDWKNPFRGNLVQKIKIVGSNWNLVYILANLNIQNSVVHTFSVLNPKYHFWVSLVKKKKKKKKKKQNYLFKLKFVRLSGVYTIQWQWSLFLFSTKPPFFGKFGPQNQNTSLSLNLVPRLI